MTGCGPCGSRQSRAHRPAGTEEAGRSVPAPLRAVAAKSAARRRGAGAASRPREVELRQRLASAGARGARHLPRPGSEAAPAPPPHPKVSLAFPLRSSSSAPQGVRVRGQQLRGKRPGSFGGVQGCSGVPARPGGAGTGPEAPPLRWLARRRRRRRQSCWHRCRPSFVSCPNPEPSRVAGEGAEATLRLLAPPLASIPNPSGFQFAADSGASECQTPFPPQPGQCSGADSRPDRHAAHSSGFLFRYSTFNWWVLGGGLPG